MGREDDKQVGELTAGPLLRVLNRLEGVKRRPGGKWQSLCPAHDDKRPSLSISTGKDGRVLMRCQAGCALETICGKMGLTVADLYCQCKRERKGKDKEIVAEYNYVDEDGVLLFQVIRYRPKGFSQRRPNGTNRWIWNVNGVRRVLYRLPDLLDADPSEWVFVVEGEKDADRLHALGLTATTNPGGAGKWRDEIAVTLRGRKVAVIPDNDQTGEQHAEQVARSLAGIADGVKIIRLPDIPEKGDVSDWLDQGGTVGALIGLAEDAPVFVAATSAPTQVEQVYQSSNVSGFQQAVKSETLRSRPGESLAELVERLCPRLRGGDLPVFQLARAVKGHPSMNGDVTAGAAVRQVRLILDARPRPAGADPWRDALGVDAAEAVAAFQRAWDDAYSTPGEPLLDRVIDEARANTIPFPTDYEGREYRVFLTAVARLQVSRGESSPVRVCTRPFGAALGANFTTVADYCHFAVRDGYMTLAKKAVLRSADGKCAEYIFDLSRVPPSREVGQRENSARNP